MSVAWRPDYYEAVKPHLDRVDRQHLHRFNPLVLLWWMAAQGIPVEEIPSAYWTLDINDEGFSVAVVSCPCKETPTVEVGTFDPCVCERAYFFTGDAVSVLNSPKGRETDEAESAAPA